MEVAMKLFSEKISDLQSLYLRQLRLLLSAEGMIAIKTPHLLETTTDIELQQVFQQCIEESEERAARLREILGDAHGDSSQPLKCRVVYGLFDEAEEMIEDCAHVSVRNAAIIAVAMRIKHYQTAAYEAIRQFARALGREQDVQMFDEILREEGCDCRQLTGIEEKVTSALRKVAA
jgi:ferritin-like metal-binding protein YciE